VEEAREGGAALVALLCSAYQSPGGTSPRCGRPTDPQGIVARGPLDLLRDGNVLNGSLPCLESSPDEFRVERQRTEKKRLLPQVKFISQSLQDDARRARTENTVGLVEHDVPVPFPTSIAVFS